MPITIHIYARILLHVARYGPYMSAIEAMQSTLRYYIDALLPTLARSHDPLVEISRYLGGNFHKFRIQRGEDVVFEAKY